VNWIFHSKDDPINNLIIDDKMKPKELVENDTLTLENIIDYYYPSTKKASGISDISIGATVLLHGNPAWKNYEKGYTLYGQFELSIPYGSTISAFQSNNFRTGQFKQASMGNGALGWGLGFLIEKKINSKSNSRIYVSSKVKLNSEATLNTPVQLFSGGHTNPDSALSYIGNTYKFKSGTILDLQLGGEKEVIDDRFLFRYTIKYKYKYKDKYISDSNDWNKWMESHDGYSSAYNIFNSGLELWFINSISQNKIGPFSFDIFAGYDTSIFTEHNYFENSLYGGITTHFQGW
jgi:hypothetical protein